MTRDTADSTDRIRVARQREKHWPEGREEVQKDEKKGDSFFSTALRAGPLPEAIASHDEA
jgi:hypothetical protein